jgi:hypothetical protein
MKFNINDQVKVRLTERGRAEIQRQHEELSKYVLQQTDKLFIYSPKDEDEYGWSTWMLWDLMKTFGSLLSTGGQNFFETEIEIIEQDCSLNINK